VTNLANKLVNPFAAIKKRIEPTTTTVDSQMDLRTNMKRQVSIVENNNITITPRRTVMISPLKRTREDDDDDEPQERRKVQMLSVNNEIRRPTGLFSYEEEESKRTGKKLHIIPFSYYVFFEFNFRNSIVFQHKRVCRHPIDRVSGMLNLAK
jgi:hypothetical protein